MMKPLTMRRESRTPKPSQSLWGVVMAALPVGVVIFLKAYSVLSLSNGAARIAFPVMVEILT